MTKEERIKGIAESENTGEFKSIKYDENIKIFEVKKIPLKYLLYNPYNGRIGSLTKSFESKSLNPLNPENLEDELIIEQFLFDSAKNRNEKTLASLDEKGQQEIGIITKDGVIIDGNRRAMLLKKINGKNSDKDFFKAIVLKDELQENKEKITLLETSYQMGVDGKVDYNPIEKYIRCKQLYSDFKLSIEKIAELMAESTTKVQDWLNILSIMDEYLGYLGSPEVYTRLEKKEGHFVDLKTYLKTYINKNNNSSNWDYEETDIEKLKIVYFDYIRLSIPVQRARVIARPSAGNSFFCRKEIWEDFIVEHELIKSSFDEEKFNDLKIEKPNKNNEDIFRELDYIWKDKLETPLSENLSDNEVNLKLAIEIHNPIKILKRVSNNLGQIREIDSNIKIEYLKLLRNVSYKVNDLMESITK
jgi:hypothetical protein